MSLYVAIYFPIKANCKKKQILTFNFALESKYCRKKFRMLPKKTDVEASENKRMFLEQISFKAFFTLFIFFAFSDQFYYPFLLH
jgi:hypothetical protein